MSRRTAKHSAWTQNDKNIWHKFTPRCANSCRKVVWFNNLMSKRVVISRARIVALGYQIAPRPSISGMVGCTNSCSESASKPSLKKVFAIGYEDLHDFGGALGNAPVKLGLIFLMRSNLPLFPQVPTCHQDQLISPDHDLGGR